VVKTLPKVWWWVSFNIHSLALASRLWHHSCRGTQISQPPNSCATKSRSCGLPRVEGTRNHVIDSAPTKEELAASLAQDFEAGGISPAFANEMAQQLIAEYAKFEVQPPQPGTVPTGMQSAKPSQTQCARYSLSRRKNWVIPIGKSRRSTPVRIKILDRLSKICLTARGASPDS